jgi:hypothetical protein
VPTSSSSSALARLVYAGMGQRQAKLARDRAASGAGAGSGSGSDGGHRQAGDDAGAREVAPPEMLVFLETAPGITWLGDILLGEACAALPRRCARCALGCC